MIFDTIRRDLHVGVRGLRRTPSFTIATVLTLALGIGLSTAVFTVANTLLLEPLPVHDQQHVIVLWGRSLDGKYDNVPLIGDEHQEFQTAARALARVAFVAREGALIVPATVGGATMQLHRSLVSADLFAVLGTHPLLGRELRAEDDARGAAPVAMLSYTGWQRRFGGDPRVVGRHFQLPRTGADVTIVGVMPQGLDYPRGTDFWTPIIPATSAPGSDHPFREVDVVGRLAPGASMTVARDELTAFFSRDGAPPIQHGVHGVVHTLPELVVGDAKPAVLIFAAAAALLLLITCINVANLLLIRGVGRGREIAVRVALGASRGRIARQLLTESVVLAAAGSSVGAALAAASLRAFIALAPADVPRLDEIHVGAAMLGHATLIGMIATALFGVAPALIATRRDIEAALRSGSRQSASRTVRRATEALVVGQVALALMILSCAGVVARSLFALEHVTLAYDSSNLLLADLTLRRGQFDGREKQSALLDRLLPQIAAIPGVAAVTPVGNVPFSGAGIDGLPMLEGQTQRDAAKNPFVNMEAVEPSYFATLGVPVAEGRGFTDADRATAPLVLVVNQSLARRFWPGESAIGKRFATRHAAHRRRRRARRAIPRPAYRRGRRCIYRLRQSPFPFAPMTLAIRTRGPSDAIVAALRCAPSRRRRRRRTRRCAHVRRAARSSARAPAPQRRAPRDVRRRRARARDRWTLRCHDGDGASTGERAGNSHGARRDGQRHRAIGRGARRSADCHRRGRRYHGRARDEQFRRGDFV